MVVDTSLLIKSKEDAFKTERICCFVDTSTELNIALSSDKDTLLRRLYEEKSLMTKPIKNLHSKEEGRCIMNKNPNNLNIDLDYVFTIISEHTFWFISAVVGDARTNLIGWLYHKPIFEMNSYVIVLNEKEVVNYEKKM